MKHIKSAIRLARKSQLHNKHAAIIVRGGRVISASVERALV